VRILYQSSGFPPGTIGGSEVLSYHLVKELSRRYHEILVVSSPGNCDVLGRQRFDDLDIVKLDFDAALANRNISALRRLNATLAELVSSFRPDILHLNDALLGSFFFLRGGATGNLPRILTLHGPIRPAGKDGLQARLAADANRVVAVSQAHYDAAIATMPAVQGKMSVILNALPLPKLAPTDLQFAPPGLLCLGRLVSDKGFDLAIRAFARLREREIPARLTIAGDGRERANLEDLALVYGVAVEVEFTGWVPPNRVASLINTTTAVLVPSRWPEPFGLVALQAAQMGRPTIASGVGGLPEIVKHGLTGLLVEPEDERALSRAIQELVLNAPLARELGKNARLHVQEHFDFQAFVDRYEELYAQVRKAPTSGRHGCEMVA
jgi:glycogen synthase